MIHNQPYQDNGSYESPQHLKAKVKVARVLSHAGYDVWYEEKFWPMPEHNPNKPFRVDIWLPKHSTYIEVDGKTHYSKRNQNKDDWKDDWLKSIGLHPIRITLAEALGAPEQILPRLPPPPSSSLI